MNARDKSFVCAAGLVLVRQKPGNAKGVMLITIVKNQRVRELSSFTETVDGSIPVKSCKPSSAPDPELGPKSLE